MEYRGYTARVEFDQRVGILFGEVEGLRDVVTFKATDVRGIEKAFRDAVDDYLAMCAARGEDPEKRYSGKFMVRVDPHLHRDIAAAAARAGKSLNALTSEILNDWVARAAKSALSDSGKWRAYMELGPETNANSVPSVDRAIARARPAPMVMDSLAPFGQFWVDTRSRTPGSLTPNTPAGANTTLRNSHKNVA